MRKNFFSLSEKHYPWLIFFLGICFFFPFLGQVHLFDWDEINFAESSREMLVSGDYFHVQINYQTFYEKPPLFMWMQSVAMMIFGVTEFAARFPNALFGIITLLSFYFIGKKHFSAKFGLTWALIYLMSFLPHVYFKSGIIDPVFNYFIFMSLYFLIRTLDEKKTLFAFAGGIFIGLATLTKGPVGLLIVLLTYLIYQGATRFKNPGKILHMAVYALAAATITMIWILPELSTNGLSTFSDFIMYQKRLLTTGDAGHEQPFFYHFVVVFIGCFPMSFFAIPLFQPKKYSTPFSFGLWMMILFWVVMILFTIVKTKIVHYSSMCWLPMSFCAAWYVHQQIEKQTFSKKMSWLFLIFGILFSMILILLPVAGVYRASIIPYVKDKFAVACMQQVVDWSLLLTIWGIVFLTVISIGFILLKRQQIMSYLSIQGLTTGLVLFGFSATVVPLIEEHSQGPAIEFYENMKGKDIYVYPLGFKSYAHFYYFEVPATNNLKRNDETWLLNDPTDKPVYFITKANNDFLDKREGVTLMYKKGGFKFYSRKTQQ